jgi:hypothetical protein
MDEDQDMAGGFAANSLNAKEHLNSMWCLQLMCAQVQLTVHMCEGVNRGCNTNVTVTLPGGLQLHDLDSQPVVVKLKDHVIKGKPIQSMFVQVPCLTFPSTTEEELNREPILQWPANNATIKEAGHATNGETYFVGFVWSNSWDLVTESRLAEAAGQDAVLNINKANKYEWHLVARLQGTAVHQLLRIEDKDLVKFNTKIKLALSPPGQPFNKSGWVLLQHRVLTDDAFGPDRLLRNKPVLLLQDIIHKNMTNSMANPQVSRPIAGLYISMLNPRVQAFEPCPWSSNNTMDCCVPTTQPRPRSTKDTLVLPAKCPCLAANSEGYQELNKSAVGLNVAHLGMPHPTTSQFSFEPNTANSTILATKTRGLELYWVTANSVLQQHL